MFRGLRVEARNTITYNIKLGLYKSVQVQVQAAQVPAYIPRLHLHSYRIQGTGNNINNIYKYKSHKANILYVAIIFNI